jgi:hypothetical protein
MLLALGPWSVRLADTGPVSSGFWRLALAVPVLVVLALSRARACCWIGARCWRCWGQGLSSRWIWPVGIWG